MKDNGKKPLVILAGPTAAGKTALSVRLAKAIGGEIISADSMQVYRRMDIGTAKIRPEEMGGVPHHMLDIIEPEENFNVADFCGAASAAAEQICARGHIPVLVGGTGFYIQALRKGVDFGQGESSPAYRKRLEEIAAAGGAEQLYRQLGEIDPAAAQKIHPHNTKRVIRALEYHEVTGKKISDHNQAENEKPSLYRDAYFVLTLPRDALYERIDRRVDQMMADGLEDEVRRLRAEGVQRGMTSMQGLGYREMMDYLDGTITREEAVSRIKRNTRHFAKRQLTWFRREKDVIWLDKSRFEDEDALFAYILQILKRKEII